MFNNSQSNLSRFLRGTALPTSRTAHALTHRRSFLCRDIFLMIFKPTTCIECKKPVSATSLPYHCWSMSEKMYTVKIGKKTKDINNGILGYFHHGKCIDNFRERDNTARAKAKAALEANGTYYGGAVMD